MSATDVFAAVGPALGPPVTDTGQFTDWPPRYWDRVCSAEETVSRLRPHFGDLGITRVAKQTGLDRLGIPCFAAFRPNSLSLALNQGKGLTEAAAIASAVMEAAEFAIAESPRTRSVVSTLRELEKVGRSNYLATRQLPAGFAFPADQKIEWLEGFDLISGDTILVPRDAVMLDSTREPSLPYSRTTNGLASGNSELEAKFHALCELIERDAASLFAMRGPVQRLAARIAPAMLHDPIVDRLEEQIRSAGSVLKLYEMATDIDAPCIIAMIEGGQMLSDRYFSVTVGYGCHPIAARAVLRAITEAAQSRITNIAGSRDDFDPALYDLPLGEELTSFAHVAGEVGPYAGRGLCKGTLEELFEHLIVKLTARDVGEIVVVPLGGEEFGISVVKLLARNLEDRAPNANWRPGARAVAAAMGAL